jgi:hypothetical protein
MIVEKYDFATVRKFLLAALSELKSEPKLFSIQINERTLTQRLSLKLQPFFDGILSVDCEYNRMWDGGDMTKKLPHPEQTWTNDDEGRTVFPDIIVHVRDAPFENLLVVEAKRNHRGEKLPEKDETKLKLFTDPKGDFQYRSGAFVNFATAAKERRVVVVWFLDGKKTDIEDIIPIPNENGGAA